MEKRDIYKEWHDLINMSQKALDGWAENPHRLEASLNRNESKGIQSGYDSFHRIKRRKEKPFEEWSNQDFENAKQEIGFNKRMLGGKPGDPVKDTGMSKWEISLRNWGHDPSLKSSPAHKKHQQWKDKKASMKYFKMCVAKFKEKISSTPTKEKIIFLDLDETLVHSFVGYNKEQLLEERILDLREAEKYADLSASFPEKRIIAEKRIDLLKQNIETLQIGTTFEIDGSHYAVHKRKGLEDFLKRLKRNADVYIFSAGTKRYIQSVLSSLGIEKFVDGFFSLRNKNNFKFVKKYKSFLLVDDLPLEAQNTQGKLNQILQDLPEKRKPEQRDLLQVESFQGQVDEVLANLAVEVEKEAIQKTACVIATGERKQHGFLFKNRDRKYKPSLKVVHTFLTGDVEALYVFDKVTGWVEGLNEYGIGIVNSALAVGRDENEKEIVDHKGKKFQDGKRILRALRERTLADAVKSVCEYEGGLRGHTFVRDRDEVYHIESVSRKDCRVTKLKNEKDYTQTNHGYQFEHAGYTVGGNFLSSVFRKNKMDKTLDDLVDFYEIPETILNASLENPKNPRNLVRDVKMFTSSMMLLDIRRGKMTLFVLPDKLEEFIGYIDRIPPKRTKKLSFHLREIHRKEDGSFEIKTVI